MILMRCHIFHEASNNIVFQSNKISDGGNRKISSENFLFSIDNSNPFDIHVLQTSYVSSTGPSSLDININGLIYYILNLVEVYYDSKDKNCFNSIRVCDYR